MKNELIGLFIRFIGILAILSVLLLFVVTMNNEIANEKPQYTQSDSIQNAKIDSVKGIYQQVIDSLAKKKPLIVTRVKWLKETDTLIYYGQDTTCIKIIERKNTIIAEQDSLIEMLDLEARTYSDMVLLNENKLKLQSKMYETLIFRKDSTSKAVQDSLRSELKLKKRSLFWQKVKTGFVAVAGTTAVIYSNVK